MTVSRGLLSTRVVLVALLPLLLQFYRGTTAAAAAVVVVQDSVTADEDLMKASPLTVAQCRAGCLHKVSVPIIKIHSKSINPYFNKY